MTVADRIIPKDAYYSHVADAIQEARWERGWTQLDLALEIGVESGACISYWESGKTHPDAWTLDRLERLFGRRLRP